MNYLKRLYEELEKQCRSHAKEIYNYAIPQSWNLYGYRPAKSIRSRELLVHPYEFYLFTLRNILKDADGNWKQPQLTKEKPSDKRDWLKHASVYSLMVRTATAWDHDRDDRLVSDNLYHLNDNGTFLKSILLLPLLKRMGVNTLLLHQIFRFAKRRMRMIIRSRRPSQTFAALIRCCRTSWSKSWMPKNNALPFWRPVTCWDSV